MDAGSGKTRRRAARPPLRQLLRNLFEWWWNLDRRRHTPRVSGRQRGHAMDEAFVIKAMARQLEEIRGLPQSAD